MNFPRPHSPPTQISFRGGAVSTAAGCDTPTWIPAAQLYGAKACFKAISTGAFKEMDPDDINQGVPALHFGA